VKRAANRGRQVVEGILTSVAGNGAWQLLLSLSPWRERRGPIVKKELAVIVPFGNEAAMNRAMARYRNGQALALTVTGLEDDEAWWRAAGRKPIRSADPMSFAAAVKQLAAKRTFEDPVLGTLTLDRGMSWYETGQRRFRYGRHTIAVQISEPDDDEHVAKAVRSAGAIVASLERAWRSMLGEIADELLDTYNDGWRDGGPLLSRAGFLRALSPESTVVGPERTTVYLRSGSLFTEHGVEVRIPRRGKRKEILVS
jgi:hypothetical protein